MPRVLTTRGHARRAGELRDAVVVRQPQAVVVATSGPKASAAARRSPPSRLTVVSPASSSVRDTDPSADQRPTSTPAAASAVASRETENAGPPYDASRLVAVINTFMGDADE